ncbi:MAG: hypothetical protein AAFR55_06515 [Pseudomonadota bacterium]
MQLIFLSLASAGAVVLQSYILLGIFLVVGLSLVLQPSSQTRLPSASIRQIAWLLIAYIATSASYVLLLFSMSARGLIS